MGYSRAGFSEIVGVDNRPQLRYPFEFVQSGALEYLAEHGGEFDAIHASPPCQGYSIMRNLPWHKDKEYPLLIDPVRELLEASGKPWIIENVMGAHLPAGWLCGTMFGLPFYRHRAFETNWFWMQPGHAPHRVIIGSQSVRPRRNETSMFAPRPRGSWEPAYEERHPGESQQCSLASEQGNTVERVGVRVGVGVGAAKGWGLAAEAMDIDWMKRDELTQAVPPAYCQFIGKYLLDVVHAPVRERLGSLPERKRDTFVCLDPDSRSPYKNAPVGSGSSECSPPEGLMANVENSPQSNIRLGERSSRKDG